MNYQTGTFENFPARHGTGLTSDGEFTFCGMAYDIGEEFGRWVEDQRPTLLTCEDCCAVLW